MNLKLLLTKHEIGCTYKKKVYVKFNVIDIDQALDYPSNFLCVLPNSSSLAEFRKSVFGKTFGEGNLKLAIQLLNETARIENDRRNQREIGLRLKKLAQIN